MTMQEKDFQEIHDIVKGWFEIKGYSNEELVDFSVIMLVDSAIKDFVATQGAFNGLELLGALTRLINMYVNELLQELETKREEKNDGTAIN